jgi:hypothetical protein
MTKKTTEKFAVVKSSFKWPIYGQWNENGVINLKCAFSEPHQLSAGIFIPCSRKDKRISLGKGLRRSVALIARKMKYDTE